MTLYAPISHTATESTGLVADITYQLAGFDRLNFVSDVAAMVPTDGSCAIRALSFEADGIRAAGLLTVQIEDEQRVRGGLVQRLQSVRGMVSVRQI